MLLKTAALTVLVPARRAVALDMPGVTATSIKIGNTIVSKGPYAAEAEASAAVIRMINEQGGINGRKIIYISHDDELNPAKTVELTRRLVEDEQVAFIFHGFGVATQTAVRGYLNAKGVPQLFVGSIFDEMGDPEHYHWTMPWPPSLRTEAAIYGKYIADQKPDANVGILYENNRFGKEHLVGLRQGLGAQYDKVVVKELSYEPTDPKVDSQVTMLRSAGVDLVISAPASALCFS
jgi:branched-chain amino acid transport system substrate-binding protein